MDKIYISESRIRQLSLHLTNTENQHRTVKKRILFGLLTHMVSNTFKIYSKGFRGYIIYMVTSSKFKLTIHNQHFYNLLSLLISKS